MLVEKEARRHQTDIEFLALDAKRQGFARDGLYPGGQLFATAGQLRHATGGSGVAVAWQSRSCGDSLPNRAGDSTPVPVQHQNESSGVAKVFQYPPAKGTWYIVIPVSGSCVPRCRQ